jgi:hypothetical protein
VGGGCFGGIGIARVDHCVLGVSTGSKTSTATKSETMAGLRLLKVDAVVYLYGRDRESDSVGITTLLGGSVMVQLDSLIVVVQPVRWFVAQLLVACGMRIVWNSLLVVCPDDFACHFPCSEALKVARWVVA